MTVMLVVDNHRTEKEKEEEEKHKNTKARLKV